MSWQLGSLKSPHLRMRSALVEFLVRRLVRFGPKILTSFFLGVSVMTSLRTVKERKKNTNSLVVNAPREKKLYSATSL